MAIMVHRPGTYSLLVDAGRPTSRSLGVPLGGPADVATWRLGNALLGNAPDAPALEITLQGPVLESTGDHRLALLGQGFWVERFLGPHGSGSSALQQQLAPEHEEVREIPSGHTFVVRPGDQIRIHQTKTQACARSYLCVTGGFQVPKILGSATAFLPLQKGDRLDCCDTPGVSNRWLRIPSWKDQAPHNVLRMLPGPHLTKALRTKLENTQFVIRNESNRMGMRLSSEHTWAGQQTEQVSGPVVPGTLQLPPGGQPILLGVDGQTIGGYPRLGYVISADLDHMGQLLPGERLSFQITSFDRAEDLRASREAWLRTWEARLRCSF